MILCISQPGVGHLAGMFVISRTLLRLRLHDNRNYYPCSSKAFFLNKVFPITQGFILYGEGIIIATFINYLIYTIYNLMNPRYYFIIIGILVAVLAIVLIATNSKNSYEGYQIPVGDTANEKDTEDSYVNTPIVFETVKITRGAYSFEAPKDWIGSELNSEGCLWDSISNNTSDGHRMAGEIGIYPKSCFNITNAMGKKEYTEKYGYYIIAFYDNESGTTAAEELETKAVYQKVVDTFALRTATTYTYTAHGFTIELPNGYIPAEEQSEGGPAISIPLPHNSHLTYVTDASFWEQFTLPSYTYLRDQKIGSTTFKVYNYDGFTIYWFKQGSVGYEYSGDTNQLATFRFVGWN